VERAAVYVVKRDGRREPFDRGKILAGLLRACEGRPVSRETLSRLAADVEREIFELGEPAVPSRAIGDRVMERLQRVDDVAYVRFASVYRRVEDVDRLMEEIQALKARKQMEAELRLQVPLIPLVPQTPGGTEQN
jgi:transcriptional repressor NrdR